MDFSSVYSNVNNSKLLAGITMLILNVGAKYVIIGHSEVRQSGESNELINQKIQTAIKSGLKVIFCVGETLKEKNKGKTATFTFNIKNDQLEKAYFVSDWVQKP